MIRKPLTEAELRKRFERKQERLDAYRAGWRAGVDNVPAESNPYSKGREQTLQNIWRRAHALASSRGLKIRIPRMQ